jgi:hypothetical protein
MQLSFQISLPVLMCTPTGSTHVMQLPRIPRISLMRQTRVNPEEPSRISKKLITTMMSIDHTR